MTELDALKALQWQMTATAFGMVLLAVLVAVMALQIHRLRAAFRSGRFPTDRGICGALSPKLVYPPGEGTQLVCDLGAEHKGWHRGTQPDSEFPAYWGPADRVPDA